MKRFRFFPIVLILSIVFISYGAERSFAEDRLRLFSLDNGMKVILQENRNAPVVALQVWVKVGSGDEKDEEAGMCHFIEHMLFKGTDKRGVRAMAKEVESLGGTINAYTSYDQTVYHITLSSRYIDTGVDILSDMIQFSAFDPVELEREKEVILEEVRRGNDDPSRRLFNQTAALLFREHPYRRPVIGFEKTVRSIKRDQMVSFFKKWYAPGRMVFVAAGDFDANEMEKKVRTAFEGLKPSPETLPERVKGPELNEFRAIVSFDHFKETYLQIAFPIPSAKHEDGPGLDALAHVLGGGETSRLVQKVKLEKGLVHSISASAYQPMDAGLFVIGAVLPAENMEKAVGAIFEEISEIAERGIASEELSRVKGLVESGLIYDRETVQGLARKLGFYEVITGDVHFEKEYMRGVALLQKEDVRNMAVKYLKASSGGISILAPSEKAGSVEAVPFRAIAEKTLSKPALIKKAESPAIFKKVLDNGIRLIVKENRSVPTVAVQASFLGGVRFEDPSKNGVSNLTAVMLTKGTAGLNSLQIAKKVEGLAGSMSGFSGSNSFGLTFTFLSKDFDEAFGLFAEVIKKPSFDPEEMAKRKRSILAAIRQQEDDLTRFVFQIFRRTLYEKHPYRMDSVGTKESVEALTRKDLIDYYGRYAVPENMVLTVVGDIDAKEVVRQTEKMFGDLPKGDFKAPDISVESSPKSIKKEAVFKKKEQAHFVLGFLGATFKNKDRAALEVLDSALSGQGGRLFSELRDKESLAYALDFVNQTNLDKGFIGVYMGTHPGKLDNAIQGVLRELKKVKEEGLTEEELKRAKKYLIGNTEIGLQTNAAQANQMSLDELYGLGFDHYRKYVEDLEKVSREDIRRVLEKYLNLDAYVLAIVRPPEEKKE